MEDFKTIESEYKIRTIYNFYKKHNKIYRANETNKYLVYDAIDNNGKTYEIKSLNHYKGRFAGVYMPIRKIRGCTEKGIRFIYEFFDGLYYIDYSANKFKTSWEIKYTPPNKTKEEPYWYIPHLELTQICSYHDEKYKTKFGDIF